MRKRRTAVTPWRILATLGALLAAALPGGAARAQTGNDTDPSGGQPAPVPYAEVVAADRPVAYWRFEEGQPGGGLEARGKVTFRAAGPRVPRFLAFSRENLAATFHGDGGRLCLADPGRESAYDFGAGQSLTIEAWVQPLRIADGQAMYVLGKGRTQNAGQASDNQNYALRLAGRGSEACLSFLFRAAANRSGSRDDWHRWDSKTGFAAGSGWHHVAVSYTFGQSGSIRGYVDGRPVEGVWSYGGASDAAPVVDDDELWIGSSMGGNAASSFQGGLDEIALYRAALPAERIAARFRAAPVASYVRREPVPRDGVLCELMEGIPDRYSWDFPLPAPSERFTQPALGGIELPRRYNAHGVRIDRGNPLLLRMATRISLAAGEHRLLIRSRNGARLYVDGKLLAQNPWPSKRTDGHNDVHRLLPSPASPRLRPVQPGDSETAVSFSSPGGERLIEYEAYVGGQGRRPELGELSVSLAVEGSDEFELLTHGPRRSLDDAGWRTFAAEEAERLDRVNRERRAAASADYAAYWQQRHNAARRHVANLPPLPVPAPTPGFPAHNAVDHFVNAALAQAGLKPAERTDDWAFLRRVTLDLAGRVPVPAEIETYFRDPPETRREQVLERLLAAPDWADQWMGYWLDVLAENPNIINPTLNNTGPFRGWLFESFQDRKPLDRLATELILMEGSAFYGGPAGFGVATQNDVPLAAKAHILAQAFLGFNLKCARCHDAPYHDFAQRDLFNLAALLNRGPLELPKTSTIPGGPAAVASLRVKVTLKPGEKVAPDWPFADRLPGALPEGLAENAADAREQLALWITGPQNRRFAEVLANRLWQRLLGRGLVEPVDDWEGVEPSHPELLEHLGREFMAQGYDLTGLTRLICRSHVYQRAATSDAEAARNLVGPARRRMTAEQVVDSLLSASGKELHVEELNIDVDGSRTQDKSISLGVPRRGWQFTSLSNERDRPSLSLPAAQTVIDVLETFGWRASRQDPLSVRPEETTPLQPAILANGLLAQRATQLSEDSGLTREALHERPVEDLVAAIFARILTRPPRADERKSFAELLRPGYAERRVAGAEAGPSPVPPPRDGVSWSNHLKPEASTIKLALQQKLLAGDPPTRLLVADWRERAEDLAWVLFNSPEFLYLP